MIKKILSQKSMRLDTALLAIIFGGLFLVQSFSFLDTLTMYLVIAAGVLLVLRLLNQLFNGSKS